MATLKESIQKISALDGYVGLCVVDSESGMMLGADGGAQVIDLEVAAAGNTEVVRAKRKTLRALGLSDQIDDILITLSTQYHLIRPLRQREGLFVYLVLDRSRANLAMGRLALGEVEKTLVL